MTPRTAWESGRAEVASADLLNGPGRAGCWLLPHAILRARMIAQGTDLPWALSPAWPQLSAAEREAVGFLWSVLNLTDPELTDVIEDHPDIGGEICVLYNETRGIMTGRRSYPRQHLAPPYLDRKALHLPNGWAAAILVVQDRIARHGLPRAPKGIGIALDDPTFPDFFVAQGDPDLWHMTVVNLNYDLPQVPGLLTWIAAQPDCDAATAALILRAVNTPEVAGQRLDRLTGYAAVAAAICTRSETTGFARRELSISSVAPDVGDDLRPWLARMRALRPLGVQVLDDRLPRWLRAPLDRLLPARVPLPVSLLSRPLTGRAPRSRWTISDECILRAA